MVYFSRFYYDTAVGGSATAIRCAYDVFGPDPLIFATDTPWGTGSGEFRLAEYPKVIESLGLPEEDKRRILGENARKMLNLFVIHSVVPKHDIMTIALGALPFIIPALLMVVILTVFPSIVLWLPGIMF